MRFSYSLAVPADTPQLQPAVSSIKLVKGRLARLRVQFLRGPHNLVSVVVREGMLQIAPAADSDAFFGDGSIEEMPMEYPLSDPAPELTLVGWSPGSRYPHLVSFYFDVEPEGEEDVKSLLQRLVAAPGR